MLNQWSEIGFFYANTIETYLSINKPNHESHSIKEIQIKWQNVLNVEPKFQNQRRVGRWQDAQTKQANECS